MRKIIEYTLVSVDGVFAGAAISGFSEYRDDAYMRDGLGQALACDAMLMGRTTYEGFAALWPRRTDPWADRINAMPKYTLLKHHLLDVLDLSIHPLVVGRGKQFFREEENTTLRFVAAKSFSKGIVKLTYEPRY